MVLFGRLVIAAAVAGVLSLVHHVGADTRRARELPSGLSGTAGGLFAVLVRAELRRHGRDA